jgi:galactokinase
LESVYRYREQWKNYRSTEQLLGHERIYFETKVGPYSGLSESEAFTTLVARVESAIANENSATLNVMTLGGQVSADVQSPPGIPGARREFR